MAELKNLDNWIRQPTTIHALGVIAAGAGAALAQVATGNHVLDVTVAVLAYVLTHLGINDNSSAEASATALTTDFLHIGQTSPTKMLGDAAAVAASVPMPSVAPISNPVSSPVPVSPVA